MRYSFSGFEFDSGSLVLSQAGKPIDIRPTEAKLLTFFLTHSERVLSKDEIMSSIWKDKVVTEQAIFQNISHLRSVFGSSAIKTFPKRGYQWQLAFEVIEQTDATQGEEISVSARAKPGFSITSAVVLALLVCVVGGILFFDDRSPSSEHTLTLIPFKNHTEFANPDIEPESTMTISEYKEISATTFLQSSQAHYAAIKAEHPMVLTGEATQFGQVLYLDFLLKGPAGEWAGVLTGHSEQEVSEKLAVHLQNRVMFELVTHPVLPEIRLAKLLIAHQNAPSDLNILHQLIKTYLSVNELDKALVLAEKLEMVANEDQQYNAGVGLMLQSQVLTDKKLYDLSMEKLSAAIVHFEDINDLKRQSDAWYAHSWLAHLNDDYQSIVQSLLKSSALALQADDKGREIEALTYLSVMAYKHRQNEDKYLYLQQAEAKMRSYELPDFNFAKVPFHYAIFADDPAAKEPHLKQVLEFTRHNPNYWVAQVCREQLVERYLEQKRLAEAEQLIVVLEDDNAHNNYLRTLYALASGDEQGFVTLALKTFEQAQLAGEKTLSLDVALLLLKEPMANISSDFYVQFIHENASEYWLKQYENDILAAAN